jgi:hypothetical protein
MSVILTGEEFVALLNKPELDIPIFVSGMAKAHESRTDAVMIAQGNCSKWHELPLSAIIGVEVIGKRRCKDHSHPLVRLQLDSKNQHALAIHLDQQSCFDESEGFSRAICEAFRDHPNDPAAILRIIGLNFKKQCEDCVAHGFGLF